MRSGLLVFAAAALLNAQTTFRTSTRFVEVSAVVTDKSGKPVEDLTRDDFELTDNGQSQPLQLFSIQHGAQGVSASEPLPAGFFSNRLGAGGTPKSATVILVDALNTPPEHYGQSRKRLAEYLHGIDPQFRVAIYRLGASGLTVFHDFTSDTALLSRKAQEARDLLASASESGIVGRVEQARPESAGAVLFGGGDAIDLIAAMMGRADRLGADFEGSSRTVTTFNAMTAIANRLKAVPGRKNLVWISTGFPLKTGFTGFASARPATDVGYSAGFRDLTHTARFENAVRALNDAAVTVYPVDARGVLALSDAADFSLERAPNASGGSVFDARRKGTLVSAPSISEHQNTMKQFAQETGGRLYFGSDVKKALSDVFEHSRVSYLLGYYAPASGSDGKFRKVRVKVNRPGLRVVHRTGYYPVPDDRAAEDDAKAALMAAVWSPVDATALPIDASLEIESGAGPGERTLALHIDGKALALEPAQDGGSRCRVELYVVQKDAESRQVDGLTEGIELPLTADKAAALEKAGLTHRAKLRIQPQAFVLRVVVRVPATGALGSLTIPLGNRAPGA